MLAVEGLLLQKGHLERLDTPQEQEEQGAAE